MHVSRFTMLIAEHRAPQYLLRAAGALASRRHGKAHGATLRRELINVPARIAHRGRDRVIVHLPRDWPWRDGWEGVFDATHRAPPARAA